MKMHVLFLISILTVGVASAAENWVHGTGSNKLAAKEAALATASINLPVGVAFHVVQEEYVANSVVASAGTSTPGYTCKLLVRHGRGIAVPEGVHVYHSTAHAARDGANEKGAESDSAKADSSKSDSAKSRSSKSDSAKSDSSKSKSAQSDSSGSDSSKSKSSKSKSSKASSSKSKSSKASSTKSSSAKSTSSNFKKSSR